MPIAMVNPESGKQRSSSLQLLIDGSAGAVFPAFTVFFGKLFDELGTSLVIGGDDAFQEQINNLVLSFMYLAIIVMVSNAAESALLGITGEILG